jgi:hypothetical protein
MALDANITGIRCRKFGVFFQHRRLEHWSPNHFRVLHFHAPTSVPRAASICSGKKRTRWISGRVKQKNRVEPVLAEEPSAGFDWVEETGWSPMEDFDL